MENSNEIELQNIDKWRDWLRKLQIIKEEIQRNLDNENNKQASRYNWRGRPNEYKVGDRVFKVHTILSNKADKKAGKHHDQYNGYFIIKKKIPLTIQIRILIFK